MVETIEFGREYRNKFNEFTNKFLAHMMIIVSKEILMVNYTYGLQSTQIKFRMM